MPRLTTNLLKGLKPEAKDYWVSDTQLLGLFVKVTPAGSVVF
jgi:hypothetical protein